MSAGTPPGTPSGALLTGLLASRAALDPAATAYTFLDDEGEERAELTYGDLHARRSPPRGELSGHCAPGERALLLFPPGLDFIVAFFACLYARVVAVPSTRRAGTGLPPPRKASSETASPQRCSRQAPSWRWAGPRCCPPARRCTGSRWIRRRTGQTRRRIGQTRRSACLGLPGLHGVPGQAFKPESPAADSIAFLQYTVGFHRGAQGRHGDARQPVRNERMIARAFGHDGLGDRRLAAAVPRHGPDRQRPAAALRRGDEHPDVADGVPAEPVALAVGDLAVPRAHQRRAELRLRPLRPRPRAEQPRPRPQLLAGRVQRRRAGAGGDAGAVRASLRALRLPRGGVLPLLRPGRGDAVRHRRPRRAGRPPDAHARPTSVGSSRGSSGRRTGRP